MRLRDLVGLSRLGLRVLAGEEHLDREIRWVHTTDLLDPSQYLQGGELILTSGLWRQDPQDSAAFVAALNKARTSGLGFAVYVEGTTPQDLVDACEQGGLPLFEVPNATPFVTISETVIQRSMMETREATDRLHRLEHRLTSALADSGGPPELLAVLADAYPGQWWVLDRRGAVLASSGCRPVPADGRAALEAALLAEKRHPAAKSSVRSPVGDVFPIRASGRPNQPPAGYLVSPRRESGWDRMERAAVDAVVEHLVLALSHTNALQSSGARQLRDTLAHVAAGGLEGEEVVDAFLDFGLRADDMCTVLVAGGQEAAMRDAGLLLDLILQRMSPRDIVADRVVLVSSSDTETATAIVPVRAPSGLAEQIRSLVSSVADFFASPDFAVGMSEPPGRLHELRQLLTQARHAQLAALTRPAKPSFATSQEIASHRLLLALSPPELACAFRTCLLEPLVAYDAEHNAELVQTLEHFLGNSCAWQRTAEELNIHVNTLRYRVERIEQITHRQLSRMEDRVDLYLAMQLGAQAVTPPRPTLLPQTHG